MAALDRSVLANFNQTNARGENLAEKLIGLFLKGAPTRVVKIRQAMVSQSKDVVRLEAHSLKSSAANIGAHRLADLSSSIERAAVENHFGSFENHEPQLIELESELATVMEELKGFFK